MICAASNVNDCVEYGSPLLTAPTTSSDAQPARPRDRLADHCEVIPAPREAHVWILDVFRNEIRATEGARDAALLCDGLARILRCSAGVCLVAVPRGYPSDFAGWLVSLESLRSSAIYVYVRRRFRREAIGTQLLRAHCAAGPVGVAYWTDDAEAGSARKLPVEHSLAAYAALLSFTRKGI